MNGNNIYIVIGLVCAIFVTGCGGSSERKAYSSVETEAINKQPSFRDENNNPNTEDHTYELLINMIENGVFKFNNYELKTYLNERPYHGMNIVFTSQVYSKETGSLIGKEKKQAVVKKINDDSWEIMMLRKLSKNEKIIQVTIL